MMKIYYLGNLIKAILHIHSKEFKDTFDYRSMSTVRQH